MEYIIYLFIIISVFAILKSVLEPLLLKRELHGRIPKPVEGKQRRPFLLLSPFIIISKPIVEKLKLGESLRKTIGAAHLRIAPVELFAMKMVLVIIGLVAVRLFFGSIGIVKGIIAVLVGFLLPDLILKRMSKIRREAIVRILPEMVDLIGLCLEAGLDFTMSVKWIVEKTRSNPLIEELTIVLEEIKWSKPRAQALKDMARRLNILELNSFVQSIVQAERMGTSVSQTFAIISEDTRMQRFQRGERIALKAPIKMLIPLLFCILPVIGIIIMGPVFLEFLTQKNALGSF